MTTLKQRKTKVKSFLFLISIILCISLSFLLLSCGAGPTLKVQDVEKGPFAVDFSENPPDTSTPDVVIGSDGLNYTVISTHTAANDDKPITGANWATYWTQAGSGGIPWGVGNTYVVNPTDIGFISLSQSIPNMADTDFTVEAWIKSNTAGALNGAIFSRAYDYGGISLYVSSNVPMFGIKKCNVPTPTTYTVNSGVELNNGEWTHAAAVFANSDHSAIHAPCVDTSVNYDVGSDTAIALDSNNKVHIAYFDVTNKRLKYVTNSSALQGWVTTEIETFASITQDRAISIAIDGNNKVHIAYFDSPNQDLKYATNTSGAWVAATVDSTGNIGRFPSIVIDSSNYAHIAYGDRTNLALKYATNASGAWVTANVDASGRMAQYNSIAKDSNGKLHISYAHYDAVGTGDMDLKYATNTSGAWVTAIVDGAGAPVVGLYSSLAVDSNNKIHISYQDTDNAYLKYATNTSGAWVTATIDSTGSTGRYTSIAIDSSNKVYITYYNATDQDLKYITNASGAWVTSTIDSTGNVGSYASMEIDSSNKLHNAYYDGTNGNLKYTNNTSGSWFIKTVDAGNPTNTAATSKHIDSYIGGEFQSCVTGEYSDDLRHRKTSGCGELSGDVNEAIGWQAGDWSSAGGVGPTRKLNAVVEEVRFWKVARTQSQIQQCKNQELEVGSDNCPISGDLIGYWKFNEGSDTSIADYSGSGNSGTKSYCDDKDCATSKLWYGGWVAGYPF